MNSVTKTQAEVLIAMALQPMVDYLRAIAGEGSLVFAYDERNIVILSKSGAHVLVRLDPAEVNPA